MLGLSNVIAMIFGTVIIFYRPGRRPRRRVDGRRIRDSIWVAAHRAQFPTQELRDAVGISPEQCSLAAKLKRQRQRRGWPIG